MKENKNEINLNQSFSVFSPFCRILFEFLSRVWMNEPNDSSTTANNKERKKKIDSENAG